MNKLLSIAHTIYALQAFTASSTEVREETRNLRTSSPEELRILIPDSPDPEPWKKLKHLKTIDPTPFNKLCSATSQLELIIPKDTNKDWMIQTRDIRGNVKKIGGDEMYITYLDDNFETHLDATATAYVTDKEDGTYELNFVGTRQKLPEDVVFGQKGKLTIHMQYTCDIGKIWPPGKQKWESSGALYRNYTVNVDASPPIKPPTPLTLSKDLRTYDVVLGAGDSIMTQLFCIKLRMRRKNMYLHTNLGAPLHEDSIHSYVQWMRSAAGPALGSFKKTALLLNSGAWDIARNNDGTVKSINDHLRMLGKLIMLIRRMLPNTDIIWRSTTAMHVHRGPDITRSMYVSNSRVKALHDAQIKLMNRYNVPVLDVYNYTYEQAYSSQTNDAIHFEDSVHTNILDELYFDETIVKNSTRELLNNNIGVLCKDGMENLVTKHSLL